MNTLRRESRWRAGPPTLRPPAILHRTARPYPIHPRLLSISVLRIHARPTGRRGRVPRTVRRAWLRTVPTIGCRWPNSSASRGTRPAPEASSRPCLQSDPPKKRRGWLARPRHAMSTANSAERNVCARRRRWVRERRHAAKSGDPVQLFGAHTNRRSAKSAICQAPLESGQAMQLARVPGYAGRIRRGVRAC